MRQRPGLIPVIIIASILAACSGLSKDQFVLGEARAPASLKCSDTAFAEDGGTLADGTPWGMRKPVNWNGVLISDLDHISRQDSDRSCALLSQGYALSGLNGHPRRAFIWDPAKEIQNLLTVMDTFAQKHGRPRRTVELGTSGGGLVALIMSEVHPTRVDGVVATCAHEGLAMYNVALDGWYVLQQLVAPDIPIAGFESMDEVAAAVGKWKLALAAAQSTPIGRARIALATAVAQWPGWANPAKPVPDPKNVNALQEAMFDSAMIQADFPGGVPRFMIDHAGGSPTTRNSSWNDTVDYERFFANANPDHVNAARELYRQAGRDMAADFAILKSAPKLKASPEAMAFWNDKPGRVVNGTPKVPVMRIHETGDWAAYTIQLDGYAQKMRANNGNPSLYRVAIAQSAGHCQFTAAESLAAVETLMKRLDTGSWPGTSPQELNALANKLLPQQQSRFLDYKLQTGNRPANAPGTGRF